jgi:hypothetical protein
MTLIYMKDEERTIKSLCALIEKAPKMDVFKLEERRHHRPLQGFARASLSRRVPHDQCYTHRCAVELGPDRFHDTGLSTRLEVPVFCTGLKTPIVNRSGLTDKDAITLAEAVAQSPSIELIDASGHHLPDIGCMAFATAPDDNSSIELFVKATARLVVNSAL